MAVQTSEATRVSPPPSDDGDTGLLRVLRDDGTVDPANDPRVGDEFAVALLRHIILVRVVDERLVTLQQQGKITFHASALGEEAAIVGAAAALRTRDWIFPGYREFGAALWRGLPLASYVHHVFGTTNDPARGRQMPDHLTAKAARFVSASSPVGTQITQAVGFAWAARMRRDDVVVLTYFGEGTTSSADFHNGANFAGVFRAPLVFFCRNNGFATSLPAHKQTASETFAEKAVAYGIESVRCDGNDVLAVYRATRDAVERAQAGLGATLIEAVTHRWEDTPHEHWKKWDPIARLRRHLELKALWKQSDQHRAEADAESALAAALAEAEAAPPPAVESMFDDVYASLPPHLVEQREVALRDRKKED
jgi:2-oxoisovalerate dehydrogenase E1 component alpha subunit